MSIVRSFSVGVGDMFTIKHNSSNFSIIDCYLKNENTEQIISKLKQDSMNKVIRRFISTHPDQDHIKGINKIIEELEIPNFYCVKNNTKKEKSEIDFEHYKILKNRKETFFLNTGCKRAWMNEDDDTYLYGSAGLEILWPNTENDSFKEELIKAEETQSPNNISPIIRYQEGHQSSFLWMGDLESEFMEKISDKVDWKLTDVIFAPHHSRKSAKIPKEILERIRPKIIVVGEVENGRSDLIEYYKGYNTITQMTAGDIVFDNQENETYVYTASETYRTDFLLKDFFKSKHESNMGHLKGYFFPKNYKILELMNNN